MRYQIKCIPTGRNFRADDVLYVRVPDMILQVGRDGFSINCLRLVNSSDPSNSPMIVGGYFLPDTVVEVVDRVVPFNNL